MRGRRGGSGQSSTGSSSRSRRSRMAVVARRSCVAVVGALGGLRQGLRLAPATRCIDHGGHAWPSWGGGHAWPACLRTGRRTHLRAYAGPPGASRLRPNCRRVITPIRSKDGEWGEGTPRREPPPPPLGFRFWAAAHRCAPHGCTALHPFQPMHRVALHAPRGCRGRTSPFGCRGTQWDTRWQERPKHTTRQLSGLAKVQAWRANSSCWVGGGFPGSLLHWGRGKGSQRPGSNPGVFAAPVRPLIPPVRHRPVAPHLALRDSVEGQVDRDRSAPPHTDREAGQDAHTEPAWLTWKPERRGG